VGEVVAVRRWIEMHNPDGTVTVLDFAHVLRARRARFERGRARFGA
jgi:hypothetical protein